jgi:sigma-B regulation protein RsbU (phosphoserine phosphatase)
MTAALLPPRDFLPPGLLSPIGDDAVQYQLADVQAELSALRTEVEALRSRDRTINFHMQRLDDELRLAARLQQDFLPKSLPEVGAIRFHALFRPAGYVSGDLYDVMRLDETHVGFYIADAVGHGMPAALLTMFLKNALFTKEITPTGYRLLTPAQTMARLNDALVSQNLSNGTFATALYGLIDTQSGTVCFARGGHPSPIILRADGSIEIPEIEGCLLGIFANESFADCSFKLAPGDRLFVFTDGIEVIFGGEKIIDSQQWGTQLQRLRHLPTAALLEHFSNQIEHSTGSLAPKDDLTIIVAEMG